MLKGVLLNKDVVHAKMRRYIENPRILLLDCNLEYKKGESQTEIEISKEEDFTTLLKMEEEYIEQMCAEIIRFKPDLIVTEKGKCFSLLNCCLFVNFSFISLLKRCE